MIQKFQFRTATKIVQLGNTVTWLRNQKYQFMGLTAAQSEAVAYILKNYMDEELTASGMIKKLGLSQSTVAGIISRLEAKGLIYRKINENDNRKSTIYPTDEGIELEEMLKTKAVETEKILLHGMSKEEQEEFNRLLQIALDNAKTERKNRQQL